MMKSRSSSNSQRRLTKSIGRSRNKTPVPEEGIYPPAVASSRYDDSDLPIRASFDDLRSAENRQLLREQLSSTFPEISSPTDTKPQIRKWPSRDNLSRFATMGRKDKCTKSMPTMSVDEATEPELLDSPVMSFYTAPKRLSTLPETQTIDVEAAITLLQTLKQTASPEQLVALHRALLPMKEVEPAITPEPYELDEQAAIDYRKHPTLRRRSHIPPGLATRGGPEDDPLRRVGDRSRRPVSQITAPTMAVASVESLIRPDRPFTPIDTGYEQTGVYKSGTLRVMNGNASPVRSMHFSDDFDIHEATEVKLVQTVIHSVEHKPVVTAINIETSPIELSKIVDLYAAGTPSNPTVDRTTLSLQDISPQNQRPAISDAMQEYTEFCASPYDRKVSSQSYDSSSSGTCEQQFVTPKASMAEFARHEPVASPSHLQVVRPEVRHADSGYSSENSTRLPVELPKSAEARTPVKRRPLGDQRWLTTPPQDDSDAVSTKHSLYTIEQVMESPAILGASQDVPAAEILDTSPKPRKRSLSRRRTLFSTLGLSKSQSSKAIPELANPSDISTPTSLDLPSANVDEDDTKPKLAKKQSKPKKLKKAVPHHIKQARKELRRLEEAALADTVLSVSTDEHNEVTAAEVPDNKPRSSIKNDFELQAPHAYARIMAAGSALEQQQAHKTQVSANVFRNVNMAILRDKSTRDVDSVVSSALSDDTDGTSIINFRAVARSLGTSPYDISTREFKSSIDYIAGSENKFRIQSPFEIGTGIPGPRTLGMDEKAASELARKKSRDYAEPADESDGAPPDVSTSRSQTPQPKRYSSMGQNLPPMPNMPIDIEQKAKKANQMVIRHLRDSYGADPSPSPSPLPAPVSAPVTQHQEPEDNNINPDRSSVVDWNAQAKIWRERREALAAMERPEAEVETHQSVSTNEFAPRIDQQPSPRPQSQHGNDKWQYQQPQLPILEEQRHSPKLQALAGSQETLPLRTETLTADHEWLSPKPQTLIADHAESSRNPQALTADHERLSPRPQTLSAQTHRLSPRLSPRPQTLSAQSDRLTPKLSTPEVHHNRLSLDRIASPVSPLEEGYNPGRRPLSTAIPSPISNLSARNSPLPRMQSPRGPRPASRLSTDLTARFPSNYAARLNGTLPESSQESSRPGSRHSRTLSPAPMTPDRYSGGLQYEWHRDVGFSGSAGSRSGATEGINRSMPSKMAYGLDLSDVPVFLMKQMKST